MKKLIRNSNMTEISSIVTLSFSLHLQFYKNLSVGLKDIVWKTDQEVRAELEAG